MCVQNGAGGGGGGESVRVYTVEMATYEIEHASEGTNTLQRFNCFMYMCVPTLDDPLPIEIDQPLCLHKNNIWGILFLLVKGHLTSMVYISIVPF